MANKPSRTKERFAKDRVHWNRIDADALQRIANHWQCSKSEASKRMTWIFYGHIFGIPEDWQQQTESNEPHK